MAGAPNVFIHYEKTKRIFCLLYLFIPFIRHLLHVYIFQTQYFLSWSLMIQFPYLIVVVTNGFSFYFKGFSPILLLILSKFKRINYFLLPVKSSENFATILYSFIDVGIFVLKSLFNILNIRKWVYPSDSSRYRLFCSLL